ncbi:hypothetical protein FA15DRAFT_215774 [Coprinopsis marcescibilis]|uniref:Uncharacterized protein n=1 Tax=Coprinopsis marcescibilis TaxID=230819 RepID=A0A5C3KGF0_COPMA|nr:hypothetical protein FA15DRAFT_215774 [Coprinopsis marcescibilis]
MEGRLASTCNVCVYRPQGSKFSQGESELQNILVGIQKLAEYTRRSVSALGGNKLVKVSQPHSRLFMQSQRCSPRSQRTWDEQRNENFVHVSICGASMDPFSRYLGHNGHSKYQSFKLLQVTFGTTRIYEIRLQEQGERKDSPNPDNTAQKLEALHPSCIAFVRIPHPQLRHHADLLMAKRKHSLYQPHPCVLGPHELLDETPYTIFLRCQQSAIV